MFYVAMNLKILMFCFFFTQIDGGTGSSGAGAGGGSALSCKSFPFVLEDEEAAFQLYPNVPKSIVWFFYACDKGLQFARIFNKSPFGKKPIPESVDDVNSSLLQAHQKYVLGQDIGDCLKNRLQKIERDKNKIKFGDCLSELTTCLRQIPSATPVPSCGDVLTDEKTPLPSEISSMIKSAQNTPVPDISSSSSSSAMLSDQQILKNQVLKQIEGYKK